jgi:hypothetical protein
MSVITDFFDANPDPFYQPSIPRDSTQQYDNWQINDIYCVDVVYSTIPDTPSNPTDYLFKSWIAVEVYRNGRDLMPYTDLNSIIQAYP